MIEKELLFGAFERFGVFPVCLGLIDRETVFGFDFGADILVMEDVNGFRLEFDCLIGANGVG